MKLSKKARNTKNISKRYVYPRGFIDYLNRLADKAEADKKAGRGVWLTTPDEVDEYFDRMQK